MTNIVNISQILIKRGNTIAANNYVGPLGELLVDTGQKTLRLQDGATPGGMATLVNSRQFANLSATVANISVTAGLYGNANVASYLPIYGGTIGTDLINFLNSNAQIESGETAGQPNSSWIEMTANIQHDIAGFYAAENGSAQVYSAQDVLLFSNTIGSTAPLWTFDRTGNLTLPTTTGRILFPYNDTTNAILDNSQDSGQYFIIQNNLADGYQGINLNTDDAQVTISSKNAGGHPLYVWNFDWQGQMHFPDNTVQTTAYQGPAGQTSFATVANVTTANTALKGYVDNKFSLLANAPAILDTLGQIATAIQTDEANIGTLLTNLTTTNSNIAAANAAIITANTAMKGYVDAVTTAWTANAATQQGLIATLQSNAATQESEITSINANITAANLAIATLQSNAASQEGEVTGLRSNIIAANSAITTLQANVGSFYTWANLNYGTSSYANANVAAYLLANPQTGTYSNTNVTAYLAGNITAGNVTSTYFIGNGSKLTNVTAQYLGASQVTGGYNSGTNTGYLTVGPNGLLQSSAYGLTLSTPNTYPTQNNINITPGTGGNVVLQGNIVAVGNIYYGNGLVATGNVTAANFLYPNGVSILTGITAGAGTYSNTNVTAYLAGNISTGNVRLSSGSWLDFINSDLNWRIGYNLGSYTKTTAQTTVDVVVGSGTAGPDGFTVGQTGGASIFELVGYTRNAWFANNVTTVGNVTAGNVLATGFFYANGTPFTSSSYGNTQVAAYLVANPQAGTYSNTNVSSYLTTATITTTGNITAGNLTTSGTYTVANITTTGAYGNITGANVISANTLQVSNGIFWANGTAWSSGGGTTYSNTNVAAYLTTQTFYSNSNVASYLVSNPQAGTYSNSNVAAYLVANPQGSTYSNTNVTAYLSNSTASTGNVYAGNLIASGNVYGQNFVGNITTGANITASYFITTGTYGNISQVNTISANNYVYANGVSILSGITAGAGTYSNANVVANLQNYVTSISTTANITTTANIIAPNYLFANGVNILSTIAPSSTYSNTNVAAYLTTQTFYSNANVVANLQNLTTNVITTANITANYFIGNGAALSSLTYASIGNIYGSSSNVTLQAGSYSWTFDNTGNLVIPTNSNIVYANGTVFTSGSGGGGGTNYSNTNVVSMLAANTAVFIGNVGNVATTYPIQSNITQLFVGNSTVLASGNAAAPYSTFLMYNGYFAANGAILTRNAATGVGFISIDQNGISMNGYTGAVTANTVPTFNQFLKMNGSIGAQFSGAVTSGGAVTGVGLTSTNGLTLNTLGQITTNQATFALVPTSTLIQIGSHSGLITASPPIGDVNSLYITTGNVTIGQSTVQTGNSPLTLRANATFNTATLYGIAGGYNSPPYVNQSVTGGSGTGMTASYSSSGGYVSGAVGGITITNPGTGYKNGDILTLPGGAGSTFILSNYNPNVTSGYSKADYVFGYDGNLVLPGNVSYASNATIFGDFTNSTVNYRTIFRPLAANSNPGVYTAPTGTGTAASWQAANTSNIANASKILIATNGTTDVQLVSGINGTGTYLPLSFLTNGSTQMQLGTAGNLLMVTGGNIVTTGNIIAGNIIANQYGNSVGTTATYSGNITASSVIASGSSGPQTRFLWDTWQANSTSALSSFTPSGTIGGNATWDSTQAYGLKLTTNTTTQSGYINWNSSTINYNYDMVITASIAASGGTGADGQWIYFGSNAAITGNPGNTNTYGGIAVMNHYYSSASQFEVYVGGTQTNIPYIGNGNYVTSGVTLWNASYTSFYNLTLKIRKIQNSNRMLEVYLNEIYQGSVNIGSWTPVGNYFGVAAYTGGSTAQNWVRQLRIDW